MSSVLKADRKQSPFEARDHALRLQARLRDLCYRKMGYKRPRINPYNAKLGRDKTTSELYDEEQQLIELENYWLSIVDEEADLVKKYMKECIRHIVVANSIYAQYISECDDRRSHQNTAIGLLYAISIELQSTLESVPPIDKNSYEQYFADIEYEINLIKGWRKSDNKTRTIVTKGNNKSKKNKKKQESEELNK